jgi:hydrogenase nickel incorporation protein HypB
MCSICGCSDGADVRLSGPAHNHEHGHNHHHDHDEHHHHDHAGNAHSHADTRTIRLEQDVRAKNNLLAERNRG